MSKKISFQKAKEIALRNLKETEESEKLERQEEAWCSKELDLSTCIDDLVPEIAVDGECVKLTWYIQNRTLVYWEGMGWPDDLSLGEPLPSHYMFTRDGEEVSHGSELFENGGFYTDKSRLRTLVEKLIDDNF